MTGATAATAEPRRTQPAAVAADEYLPRITVVTPSFEQGRYIEQTIRSVIEQGYPDLEYLILDGGSRDGTLDAIRRFEDRITWWCSEPDGGQAEAIARGFDRATGEILCWLNSDDVFLPGCLLAVGRYFREHPGVEVLSGGAYVVDAAGGATAPPYGSCTLGVRAGYHRLRFFGQEGIFQPATFWRRQAYEAVGGLRRDLAFIMDLDLFTRLARRRRFGRLPRFLACFRRHDSAKTTTLEHIRQKELDDFRQRYGVVESPVLLAQALYWWYRTENRFRKAGLAALVVAGILRLEDLRA